MVTASMCIARTLGIVLCVFRPEGARNTIIPVLEHNFVLLMEDALATG